MGMTKQEETKTCNVCYTEQPLVDFYKSPTGSDGLRSDCKDCENEASRLRYRLSDAQRLARLAYGKTDKARYTRLKSNAKRRGTGFFLGRDEFIAWLNNQERGCHYCGVELNTEYKRSTQLTVDRKNNAYGYSVDNIVLSCWRCNSIKSDVFTEDEMIEIGEKYLKYKRLING